MSTRDRVILLILFVGFLTFALEIRYEHRYIVKEDWVGWVPIVYSALAAFGCLIGMAKNKAARTTAATILFLGIGVSLVGLYKHTRFDPAVFEKFLFPDRTVYAAAKGPDGEKVTVTLSQPLAAPLGILGLASVGFIITSGLFKTSGKGS